MTRRASYWDGERLELRAGTVVTIIGAGRIGTAIGSLLAQKGVPLAGVVARSQRKAEAAVAIMGAGVPCADIREGLAVTARIFDEGVAREKGAPCSGANARRFDWPDTPLRWVVFVTVSDDAVTAVADTVGQCIGELRNRPGVARSSGLLIHTSGALSSSALKGGLHHVHAGPGAKWWGLSMHPFQTVATAAEGARRLIGAYWGIESDGDQTSAKELHGSGEGDQPSQGALETEASLAPLAAGEALVHAMEGVPMVIRPGQKQLYHAAAVMSSNYAISLLHMSASMMVAAGIAGDDAVKALAVLMEGAAHNAADIGLPHALTGPIDRGDVHTVAGHLQSLAAYSAGGTGDDLAVERLYRMLGSYTVGVALEKHEGDLPSDYVHRLQRIDALLSDDTSTKGK